MACPLCKKDWVFPFSARQIFGKPYPTPETIVNLHLYGAGKSGVCDGFDYGNLLPKIERLEDTTVRLEFEPVKPLV